MIESFKATEIPLSTLYGYISTIESLFSGNTLTYSKIKEELEFVYGVKATREQIERYYSSEDEDCKDCDEYITYKNLGYV